MKIIIKLFSMNLYSKSLYVAVIELRINRFISFPFDFDSEEMSEKGMKRQKIKHCF